MRNLNNLAWEIWKLRRVRIVRSFTTELRVRKISLVVYTLCTLVKSTFLKNGIPFMAQGSTIQRKADKVENLSFTISNLLLLSRFHAVMLFCNLCSLQ